MNMNRPINEAALLEQVEVEKEKLRTMAVRISSIGVVKGEGYEIHIKRPKSIHIMLTGGSGTGKSTFINFARSFLSYALGEEKGYIDDATTGDTSDGQITRYQEWYNINDNVVISDTRGFLQLIANVQESIRALATCHDAGEIDMANMEKEAIRTRGNRWQKANNSHHAVLFFLTAKNCIPFDRPFHDTVASTLHQLQKHKFQPLIVISQIDLATPDDVQEYRTEVLKHLTNWRGPKRPFRDPPKLKGIQEKHIMCISNVCDMGQWYRGTKTTPASRLEFYKQGTAVLKVLESAANYGNEFIKANPQVGASALAWATYLGGFIPSRLDNNAQIRQASTTTSPSRGSTQNDIKDDMEDSIHFEMA